MNQRSRITGQTAPTTAAAERAARAAQIIGFRIMRETEIAPSWWARPIEIGETVSGEVAYKFCTEQNAVTLDPDRLKKHRYYAEPIYAATQNDMDEALRRVQGRPAPTSAPRTLAVA
ncbi:hypothetical protein ABZ329_29605 [Streptomyces rubiginosohelvolus]|uniref:hypothetical protein n=1 Tax=Streptomyces rubiginosohelvolus TaxID=67362 RepID=UPI003405A8C3